MGGVKATRCLILFDLSPLPPHPHSTMRPKRNQGGRAFSSVSIRGGEGGGAPELLGQRAVALGVEGV